MSEPCPRCTRPNAAFRTTCLYCGAVMPNPTARPAEPARRGPDNLDDLVRDAMRGGQTDKLRAALSQARDPDSSEVPRPEPPAEDRRRPGGTRDLAFPERRKPTDSWVGDGSFPPSRTPTLPPRTSLPPGDQPMPDRRMPGATRDLPFADRRAPRESHTGDHPLRGGIQPVLPQPTSTPVVRSAPLLPWTDRLVRAAQRAVLLTDDPAGLLETLMEAEDALAIAYSSLPATPPGLPPIRQAWLLVLPPYGDPEEIGMSVGVDQATARMLSQGKWPRVALRGDSPNLGRRPTFDQIAISREELLAVPQAMGVLGKSGRQGDVGGASESDWVVTDETIWLAEPMGGGVAAAIDRVLVIVPGEVETRTTREAPSENRWLRKRLTAVGAGVDRRVRILDLHTENAIFRLVEGTTRTEGLPGHDPSSARRAFAGILDHLVKAHAEAEVVEERLCSVGADGKSAWPAWEEHTRVARLYTEKAKRQAQRV